jgi:small multidrug resistance pump
VLLNVTAQFLLKHGVRGLQFNEETQSIVKIATNPFILCSLLTYGAGFILYSIVLSKLDLSTAYPVASVSTIALIVLVSAFLMNETIDIYKAIGLALSVIGIILIYR